MKKICDLMSYPKEIALERIHHAIDNCSECGELRKKGQFCSVHTAMQRAYWFK